MDARGGVPGDGERRCGVIHSVIWCDGPGCSAIDDGYALGQGHRADVERLRRAAAAERGWVRMRPAWATDDGDYCPSCVAAIREGRVTVLEARR
jgi:hypothetical protein